MRPRIELIIEQTKAFRRELDGVLQRLKTANITDTADTPHIGQQSEERSLAIIKLKEAIMWLGMDLKQIGENNPQYVQNPYPNSYGYDETRPSVDNSVVIDRTADGLQL